MKLKNKKTGETGYYLHTHRDYKTGVLKVAVLKDGVPFSEFKPYEPIYDYNSLAELNEEWCDYEEPKEYWYIDWNGEAGRSDIHDERTEQMKLIGNYFDSREEAEKAVEKLKAWKRLVGKGFEFESVGEYELLCGNGFEVPIRAIMPPECYADEEVKQDLIALFGGEE